MRTERKGFTLIELLVVIAIIGLLSTLAVVALNSARQKSRDAKRLADVKQLQTALELYYGDQNGYPGGSGVTLGSAAAARLCANGFQTVAACTGTVYMGGVPAAPLPSDGTCPTAGAGSTDANPYLYSQTGSGTGYTLRYCLGAQTGGAAAGVHTASESSNL